jgi:hypothetical protein
MRVFELECNAVSRPLDLSLLPPEFREHLEVIRALRPGWHSPVESLAEAQPPMSNPDFGTWSKVNIAVFVIAAIIFVALAIGALLLLIKQSAKARYQLHHDALGVYLGCTVHANEGGVTGRTSPTKDLLVTENP